MIEVMRPDTKQSLLIIHFLQLNFHLFSYEWYKSDGNNGLFHNLRRGVFGNQHQILHFINTTNRNNHSAAWFELVDKRLRNMLGGCCDDNCIKWGMLRPSFIPVANLDFHIIVTHSFQPLRSLIAQPFYNFYRIYLFYQFGEDGSLIA